MHYAPAFLIGSALWFSYAFAQETNVLDWLPLEILEKEIILPLLLEDTREAMDAVMAFSSTCKKYNSFIKNERFESIIKLKIEQVNKKIEQEQKLVKNKPNLNLYQEGCPYTQCHLIILRSHKETVKKQLLDPLYP